MHKSLKTQYNNPEVLSFAASAVLHLFFIYFPPPLMTISPSCTHSLLINSIPGSLQLSSSSLSRMLSGDPLGQTLFLVKAVLTSSFREHSYVEVLVSVIL